MSSTTGGLKELHQLRLQLTDRQKKLDLGPRQILAKKKLVNAKQTEIEDHKANTLSMQKQADEINLQIKTNEQKNVELTSKLNQAASNKEFDILKTQIARDVEKNLEYEDRYLEILEQVDGAKQDQVELESQLKDAESTVKAVEARVAEAEPGLKRDSDELAVEIKTAEKCIPSHLVDDYKRMVIVHGADCIASVDEGACTNCFEELAPQLRVEIRMGKVIRCRSCGRLLYSDAEE
jgi:uncharacterized protein